MLADIIPKKNKGKKLSLGMIFVINTFTWMNRASNDTWTFLYQELVYVFA